MHRRMPVCMATASCTMRLGTHGLLPTGSADSTRWEGGQGDTSFVSLPLGTRWMGADHRDGTIDEANARLPLSLHSEHLELPVVYTLRHGDKPTSHIPYVQLQGWLRGVMYLVLYSHDLHSSGHFSFSSPTPFVFLAMSFECAILSSSSHSRSVLVSPITVRPREDGTQQDRRGRNCRAK